MPSQKRRSDLLERVKGGRAARRMTSDGISAYRDGNLAAAEEAFESAILFLEQATSRTSDAVCRAYLNLAVVEIERGMYEEGRRFLRYGLAAGTGSELTPSVELLPMWDYEGEAEPADTRIAQVASVVKRAVRTSALDPVRALRLLATFDNETGKRESAAPLAALADALSA